MIDTHRSWLKIILPILIIGIAAFVLARQNPNNTTHAQTATCNVTSYGAKGDGSNDDTNAIQAAINACTSSPQNTIFFPPGTYQITHTLNMYANMTFKLDNAKIIGADDFVNHKMIFADQVDNIAIIGPGTIERGWGGAYVESDDEYWLHILSLDICDGVRLENININSADYDQHPGDGKPLRGVQIEAWQCSNVTYDNVRISGYLGAGENDGLKFSSGRHNISVSGGSSRTGDDPLVFHGPGNFTNVHIGGGLVLEGRVVAGAILLTNDTGSVNQNMSFDNITIEHSNDSGICIIPRGTNVTYNNISFSHITMNGDIPRPFFGIDVCWYAGSGDISGLKASNFNFNNISIDRRYNAGDDQTSQIKNIHGVNFENITYYYPSGQNIPNPLVRFSNIDGLCVYNFKIIKGGSEVSNPLSYLDWSDSVSGVTTNQACSLTTIGTLDIYKSANKIQVSRGGTLSYTLSYQNNASAQFKNVVITDQIPNGTSYIPGSASHGGQYKSGQLIWNLGTVAAGAGDDITFDIKVD